MIDVIGCIDYYWVTSEPGCPRNCATKLIMLCSIQVAYTNIEGNFYQDVHALEMKYAELFKPIYEKVGNFYQC